MSKTNTYLILIFITFALLFRLVLPYSDEPDFHSQSYDLINYNDNKIVPYYYLKSLLSTLAEKTNLKILLENYNQDIKYYFGFNCQIDAPLTYFDANVSPACHEDYISVVIRLIILIIIISPLLVMLIFKDFFKKFFLLIKFNKNINTDLDNRVNSLSLSLIIPSLIYALGFLSIEQTVLIVSLLIFLFYNTLIIVPLLLYLLLIDLGNFTVVFLFILISYTNFYLYKYFRIRTIILFNFIFVIISYYFGLKVFDILFYILNLVVSEPVARFDFNSLDLEYIKLSNTYNPGAEINEISHSYNTEFGLSTETPILQQFISKLINMEFQMRTSGEYEKYPIILRPIITYLSSIYFPPSLLKLPILHIFSAFIVIFAFLKLIFNPTKIQKILNQDDIFLITNLISVFTCILTFVLLFPIYANAKYYLFLFPFIISVILKLFKLRDVFLVIFSMNVLLLFNITLYHLI